MGKKNKTNRVHTVDTVDNKTKDVLSSVSTSVTSNSEQDFCKIYLHVLYGKFKPTNSEIALFCKLIDFMDYDNNIHLKRKNRQEICSEMGLSATTINHTIKRLADKGLLFRLEYNTYIVNPYVAAKGLLIDIINVRKPFGEVDGKWYYVPMDQVRDLKEIFNDHIKNQL